LPECPEVHDSENECQHRRTQHDLYNSFPPHATEIYAKRGPVARKGRARTVGPGALPAFMLL
jgi:hypothetical protein